MIYLISIFANGAHRRCLSSFSQLLVLENTLTLLLEFEIASSGKSFQKLFTAGAIHVCRVVKVFMREALIAIEINERETLGRRGIRQTMDVRFIATGRHHCQIFC